MRSARFSIPLLALAAVLIPQPTASAGGGSSGKFSRAQVCASQPQGSRVRGVVLTGPRLHGLAVDDTTQHAFVLSSGSFDLHGKYTCVTSIITLNARDGRIQYRTPISLGAGPQSYDSLAVDGPAHRLLALDSGNAIPQEPQRAGTLSFLDSRTVRVVKTIGLQNNGPIAIDVHTYRAFVVVPGNQGASALAIIAVTRGIVLRKVSQPSQDIAIDQRTNRVFLLNSGIVTTLDGATGNVLNTAALPGGFYQYNGYGLDERTGRLFVAQLGLAPPHGGVPNPPNTLSLIDTKSGSLIKTITAGGGVPTGRVLVDEPAGIALTWTNSNSPKATVLDARDGSVLKQVKVALPGGVFYGPTVTDPNTGDIYGYTGNGMGVVRPGAWGKARSIFIGSILPLKIVVSASAHRVFGLQWDVPTRDSVRALCTRRSCT